jgi:hypothetical protein
MNSFRIASILIASTLSACAAIGSGPNVGFRVEKLNATDWVVTYEGRTTATENTAQTLGLYRCATIALEQGYDGFEIRSNIDLSEPRDVPYKGGGASRATGAVVAGGLLAGPVGAVAVARSGADFGQNDAFPVFSSEIRLVKKPFSGQPPKVFDAASLKATLEPFVNGKKCDNENICPHDYGYLRPGG